MSSSFPLQVNDELKLSLRQSSYSVQLGLTGYISDNSNWRRAMGNAIKSITNNSYSSEYCVKTFEAFVNSNRFRDLLPSLAMQSPNSPVAFHKNEGIASRPP